MRTELKHPPAAQTPAWRSPFRMLAYLLVFIPPAITLWAIHEFGIDVPYYNDDWDFTGLMLDRWLQGKLTLGLFFAQHMEHRVLLPRAVLFGIALITHWHTKAGMYANVAVVLAVGVLLIRLLARSVSLHSAPAIFAMLVTSALLFGLIQWEIWLWSPGMQIPMIALLLVAGFCIAKSSWRFDRRFTFCALLALLATYSSGNGFLLWILLPPVLFVEGDVKGRRRVVFGMVWLAVAVLGIALYFVHYVSPPSDVPRAAGGWLSTVAFILQYLGSAIGSGTSQPGATSLAAGVVLASIWILAMGFVFMRRDAALTRSSMPWLCLGAYSLLTGVMIAVARAGGGAMVAMSSRYIGYSVYLPVSLACLAAIELPRPREKYTAMGLMSLLLLLHLHTTVGAMTWLELARAVRAQARCTLRYLDLASSEQIRVTLSPYPEVVRAAAHRLDQAGYLQPPIAQKNEVPEESMTPEHVAGSIVQLDRVGDTLHVLGWIRPTLGNDPIAAIAIARLRQDGTYVIVGLSTGAARTDTDRPMETLISPVWHAEIPADQFPGDEAAIALWGLHANSFRFTRLDPSEPAR